MPLVALPFADMENPPDPAALGAFLVPVVLAGLHRLDPRPVRRPSAAFLVVSLAVALAGVVWIARIAVTGVLDPPDTDSWRSGCRHGRPRTG